MLSGNNLFIVLHLCRSCARDSRCWRRLWCYDWRGGQNTISPCLRGMQALRSELPWIKSRRGTEQRYRPPTRGKFREVVLTFTPYQGIISMCVCVFGDPPLLARRRRIGCNSCISVGVLLLNTHSQQRNENHKTKPVCFCILWRSPQHLGEYSVPSTLYAAESS